MTTPATKKAEDRGVDLRVRHGLSICADGEVDHRVFVPKVRLK